MALQKDNYALLIQKLDEFIRKYYVNQIIRGSLYSIGLILALFLGLNFAENFFYFAPSVKTPLFWGFVGASVVALTAWVLIPMFHYFHLGKVISHEQAAGIVGEHFTNVKDKLLNILQLRKQADTQENRDLILASINQKSEEIKPVPFKAAIDLQKNKKHLRYALPPLLLLLSIMVIAPSFIQKATARLFNYSKEFEREAPFKFYLDKEKLKVVQFQDYDMTVKVDGAVLPNEVFIDVNGYQYRLQKDEKDPTLFSYKFSNVQQDVPFKLFSGTVSSTPFALEVLKKPNIAGLDVSLDYPEYIGRPDEMLANQGDLIVPQGTKISWLLNAENTEDIKVSFAGGNPLSITRQGDTRFVFSKQVKNDEPYKLFISNAFLPKADSVSYSITVVPDLYPTINVEKFDDSLNKKRIYFVGDAGDDYGLSNLSFNYQVKSGNNQGQPVKVPLQKPSGKSVQYTYTFNAQDLTLKAGDEVTYYFEIFDNDGVNGAKAAKTQVMVFAVPSVEQVEKDIAKNNDEIKDDLKKAIQESKKIQQDVQKLREKMLQQKDVDWQMKKEAEKLMQRQNELEKQIKEAQKNFEQNLKQEQEINKQDEQIMKKQEQLQKMFEELQNPEMKELLKQIEELLQKQEKDQALDKMDEAKFSNEEIEKNLERMQEMFKQMEVESMMQDQIDKLEELAKKEDELSQDTEGDKKSQEELKKEQDALNKEFDKLEKQQEEMEKKNKELKRPDDMPDTKEDDKEIEKDMKDSKDDIEKKENQKAAQKQKKAANKMKNKANKMKSSQKKSKEDQTAEDIKAIRQLLENLVSLSFDQEQNMKDFQSATENTPRYIKLVQQQKKLQGDFEMIDDSLQKLAQRQPAIQTFVVEKVTDIKQNMAESLEKLEDRKKYEGQDWQQRTMKNVNDLALMLSESMEQMQNEMNEAQGNESCPNPGDKKGGKKGNKKGGQPKDKMGEGQKGVNESLKKMKEKLQGMGKGEQSKEFAKMAAQQSAMREALKRKQKELQERGKGDKGLQDIIDQMEKTETELVNKQLTNETMKRQDQILTRLLESDKAERERKEDEERKSNAAKEQQNQMPPSLQEYIKKRQAEVEQYNRVSPNLKPYYKTLVEEYFKSLKGSGGK